MSKAADEGATALTCYLESVYLAELAGKLIDRDNHLLLSELVEKLKDGTVEVTSEEQGVALLSQLVKCLGMFERDPEFCSSRYHVKVELHENILRDVHDLKALEGIMNEIKQASADRKNK